MKDIDNSNQIKGGTRHAHSGKKSRIDTKRLVGIAVFSSLAFVVALVCQIIPSVAGFLSLDFKDAVIAMASFIYGPTSAVLIALIASAIELITVSTTGWYGFAMNFVSSATFSLVASLIYRKFKSLNGAIASFASAVVATVSVMLLLNTFVTPLYMAQIGVPLDRAGVVAMIPTVLLPFNLAKSLINSALAMLLYKPVSNACRRIGFAMGDARKMRFNKASAVILAAGLAFIVAAVILLLGIPSGA